MYMRRLAMTINTTGCYFPYIKPVLTLSIECVKSDKRKLNRQFPISQSRLMLSAKRYKDRDGITSMAEVRKNTQTVTGVTVVASNGHTIITGRDNSGCMNGNRHLDGR